MDTATPLTDKNILQLAFVQFQNCKMVVLDYPIYVQKLKIYNECMRHGSPDRQGHIVTTLQKESGYGRYGNMMPHRHR